MFGAPNDSTILRLRVNGSDLDPLALRGRVTSILNEVSLQPRLPPSATLFIRKLKDPLPGSLQLDTSIPRAPQAWRHAFNTKFDQLVSSAARPAFGPVADSVESVVFYDYAELLASLSADWCSGSVMSRWWWQSFIKRGDIARLIKQLWRDRIEYAPAALQHLVKRNAAVEFVRRLSDVEVREILQRVVLVFGLTRMTRIKAADFFPVGLAPQVEHVARIRSETPWMNVVPESDTPRLRPVQQLFVGIVLMVNRAPSRVRTLSFAREVERWIQECVVEVPRAQPIIEETSEPESFEHPTTPTPIRVNPIASPPVILRSDPPPEESASSVAKKPPEPVKIGNAIFNHEEPDAAPGIVTAAPIAKPDPLIETTSPEPIACVTAPEPLDAVAIETDLGGLFYLINLAIFMEIYSDFTSPVEQFHDDLSIWHFVAIVGRELTELEDPIWSLLSKLADPEDNPIETPTWLAELLPSIRARLALALGISDEDDLAELLLHHHARVIITPTHIDIFFALATHPIEIRFSGLDRDPGWVPAAGRFIAFHYD